MRPILLFLAAAASCESATNLGRPRYLFEELIAQTLCGDNKSISKCLLFEVNLGRLGDIEQCYIAGGCSKVDAKVGAVQFAREYRAQIREVEERVYLKRRDDSSAGSASDTTTRSEKTTAKSQSAKATASYSDAPSSASFPSSAYASTTSDLAAPSASASTAASTISSATTSISSSSLRSSTTSSQVTSTGTLLCSTINTVQTSVCSISAGTTLSCTTTTAQISRCAAGNLCMTNSAGENTCMKIDNTVGPAGILIGIIFSFAIGATLVGLTVMKYKASRSITGREAESQALSSGYSGKGKGKTADVAAVAPKAGSEANLQLISEPVQEFNNSGRWAHLSTIRD